MEVKEYSPLWQRDSNSCGVCTPKYITQFSNYWIEDNYQLYFIVDGFKYRPEPNFGSNPNINFWDLSNSEVYVRDEDNQLLYLEISQLCNYEYGYAYLEDEELVYENPIAYLQFVEIETANCRTQDFILITYQLDCITEPFVICVKGAYNRIPANLADEATGILPSGQSKRYFARIERKVEIIVKDMNLSDLELMEYVLNTPSIQLSSFLDTVSISEGSIFTFENSSYGLYYGICEVVESTMIVQKCCEVSGS